MSEGPGAQPPAESDPTAAAPLQGAERGSLRDLLPELAPPALPEDASAAAVQAFVRGALTAAVMCAGFVLVIGADTSAGAPSQRLQLAFQLGVPLGLSLALTPVAELWSARRRSALGGAALAYLGGLLGTLLGLLQATYAIQLGLTLSPGAALDASYAALESIRARGGVPLVLFPLVHVAAWSLRVGLHRERGVARWLVLTAWALACAGSVLTLPVAAWIPVFVFAALPALLYLNYWGADRLIARLRGERAEPAREDTDDGPLPPLRPVDRLVVGGRGFLLASLAWLASGLTLALLTHASIAAGGGGWLTGGGWIVLVVCVGGWLLHMVFSANYAALLNRRRAFARAAHVARHRLADPWSQARAQRRADTHALIGARCGLGQLDQARALLPQAMTRETRPGLAEQGRRYTLALGFLNAGDADTCRQVLDTVEAWTPRLEPLAGILRALAWDQLGDSERAQRLTRELDANRLGARGRAVILNNLAVFELRKPDPDAAQALRWAQEASASRWGRLAPIRGTLGAALLVGDGDPQEALEHLEAGIAQLATYPPQGQAWALKCLGDACRALGRLDDARQAYRRSAAACDCPAARLAADALAALDRA